MSTQIESEFEVTTWEDASYDEPEGGPRLARATVEKAFRGALEGESTAELLLCQADVADLNAGAGYVASERFVGSLRGKNGSFVFQHAGLNETDGSRRTFGHVVPGSARGELVGLRGEVEISVTADGVHTLTLDYTFDRDPGSPK